MNQAIKPPDHADEEILRGFIEICDSNNYCPTLTREQVKVLVKVFAETENIRRQRGELIEALREISTKLFRIKGEYGLLPAHIYELGALHRFAEQATEKAEQSK